MPSSIETTVIDGKAIAERLRARVAQRVGEFVARNGKAPRLATILVGDDPASQIYVRNKHNACDEVGIETQDHRMPAYVSQAELAELIGLLNNDGAVSGILLQLPLPPGLDSDRLVELIATAKDVDGLTPASAGLLQQGRAGLVPCTPTGVVELLDDVGAQISGAEAVVVGRSILVGKPVAALLTNRNATVTICHSRTRDLGEVCRRADILVAAVGVPQMITGDMIKPGAIVIDVGINRTSDGLRGDVDFKSALGRASAITPVPGGVGPMTIACLARNTLDAAQMQLEA